MHVLVLHSELGTLRGGGENFSRNLFAHFARRGHRVRAAFTADPFGRYPFSLPAGLDPEPIRGLWSENLGQATLSAVGRRLTPMPALRARWDYLQNALAWRTFYWSNRRFHSKVMRAIERLARDSDVVYVHSNPYLASDVARLMPTVLRLPGPLTSEVSGVLEGVHAVCANGDALKRIREFLGERALELPVGLDEERFAPGPTSIRAAFGWTPRQHVIGYVGRLSHIKGVDILAEGFRRLAAKDPDARLVIVGGGEEEPNLRATLRHEIARGVVRCSGDVAHDRLPEWYRAMDLLVMPSRYENFSNALLEGLACGVPFVGSDVGGNRALYETGAGWVFETGSPRALAATLTAALADGDERRARGERGRLHVSGRYNWSTTARRLEQILEPLRGAPCAPQRSPTALRSVSRTPPLMAE
jgi:glycosyltransferase involved in cell wall biosynthesis